jgi:hypothetical protein
VRVPDPVPIKFATSPSALAANDALIRENDFDLDKLISSLQHTTLGYTVLNFSRSIN